MPDQDERNPQGVTFFIVAMAIVLCLLFFGVVEVFPQTNMGPVRTPQINTTLYVGQSGYATIQSAVMFACRTGSQSYAVTILPGVTTGDSPTSVTGGCSGTYIADLHQLPHRYYAWSGTAYVLSSTLPGFSYTSTGILNLAAGSELANSPLCSEATGCPTQPTSYPPAGIGISTGISWDPNSIDPATVPRTNTANAFTQPQTIAAPAAAGGTLPNPSTGVRITASPNVPTPTNQYADIHENTYNGDLTISSAWPGSLYLQTYGNGNTYFDNGNGQTIANLDPIGNFTLAGVINSGRFSDQAPTTLPIGGPAYGLSASNGNLHLWSDNGEIAAHGGFAFTEPLFWYPGWNYDLNALGTGGIYQGQFSNAPPETATADSSWIIFNSPTSASTNFGFQMAFPLFNWGFNPVFYWRQSVGGNWSGWWQLTGVTPTTTTTRPNLTPEQRRAEQQYLAKLAEIRTRQSKNITPSTAPSIALSSQLVQTTPRPTSTPKSSRASCTAGAMWNDARYIYVCVKSGEIKRAAVSSF